LGNVFWLSQLLRPLVQASSFSRLLVWAASFSKLSVQASSFSSLLVQAASFSSLLVHPFRCPLSATEAKWTGCKGRSVRVSLGGAQLRQQKRRHQAATTKATLHVLDAKLFSSPRQEFVGLRLCGPDNLVLQHLYQPFD